MNKRVFGFLGFVSMFAVLVLASCGTARAGLNVNINFGPPQIVEPAPPEVVYMPQSGVYYVPGVSFDVFFYNGYWWAQRGDGWYRSTNYNRGWARSNSVPTNLRRVPRNYRNVYQKERPIKYEQWKGHGRGNGNKDHGNRD